MGGNALKLTPTRRYSTDEYHRLVPIVMDTLARAGTKCDCIPAYMSKPSFGDMDILHSDENLTVDSIRALFSPNEIVKNGPVISFDHQQLQIDLIYSPTKLYDYALNYFSWNDAGNLVGRIAHTFGLKHGHSGLILPVSAGTRRLGQILLTTDYAQTLGLLGMSPLVPPQTLEDIFEWVSSSVYFSPEIYLFENLNAVSRVRDKKRATYNHFLEWCKLWNGTGAPRVSDKSQWLPVIFDHFPGAQSQWHAILDNHQQSKVRNLKFNGDIVGRITGLRGRELGQFIHRARVAIGANMHHMCDDEIEDEIRRLHQLTA